MRTNPSSPGRNLAAGARPQLGSALVDRHLLSIRCSSIHFLPSRSFPVSEVGEFERKVVALDAGGSSGLS
jgi:hypothetical protein